MVKRVLIVTIAILAIMLACTPGTKPAPAYTGPSWLVADDTEAALEAPVVRASGPTDWRDEIIYFMVTDRFCDGDTGNNIDPSGDPSYYDTSDPDAWHGGDFKGIISKVDYLRRLGITSVWITPIVEPVRWDYQTAGYHGYWAHDMTRVNRYLTSATNQDNTTERKEYYKDFVDTMHDNGLLVVQDIVVNHIGSHALYYIGPPDPEWDWEADYDNGPYSEADYYFLEDTPMWGEPGNSFGSNWQSWAIPQNRTKPRPPFDQESFYNHHGWTSDNILGDLSGLEDLRTASSDVRLELTKIYGDWYHWAGVDGFRIDTVKHIETTFWDNFCPDIRARVNAKEPGRKFMQFGEVFDSAHTTSNVYTQGNRIDTLLNFDFYQAVKNSISRDGATTLLSNELGLISSTTQRDTTFDNGGAGVTARDQINFIDNHDKPRFMNSSSQFEPRLYLALMYLLTCKGIPCIYYNTENATALAGSTPESGRVDMPDFVTTNKKSFTLIRKLATIRTDNIAIRRGEIEVLKDSAEAGIFAYARYTGTLSENIICVMNNSDTAITETVDVSTYQSNSDVLENILKKEFGIEETVTVTGGSIEVTIEPYSMQIYKIQ